VVPAPFTKREWMTTIDFIPEAPWTIGNGTLTASNTAAKGTIEVTLTRS
jgi:hypothetical protein